MRISKIIMGVLLAGFASVAAADLEAWKDYDISVGVSNVTTVKVDSNMIDKYLEGLSKTWVTGNDFAIELGQMESYWQTVANSMSYWSPISKTPALCSLRKKPTMRLWQSGVRKIKR